MRKFINCMNKSLTQNTIQYCQQKFNLNWQVPMAFYCQQMVGFKDKDVLDVGGILPKEFVLDYLKARSWTSLDTIDYAASLAEDISDYQDVVTRIKKSEGTTFFIREDGTEAEYRVILTNIEDLPSEYYDRYDLIFSTATFEHLNKFPLALEKMFLALRPSGKLFSMFSPIWSAHDGHHLRTITDKQGKMFNFGNSPIPPWGHLLMRSPELYKHLCHHTDQETAGVIVHHVYNHPSINRLFTEDYFDYINQTDFEIEKFQPTFYSQIPQRIQEKLESLYPGRKQFANNGILTMLKKNNIDNIAIF
jgi:SAM-dependent methyltransferase